jgi:hypothetical protein
VGLGFSTQLTSLEVCVCVCAPPPPWYTRVLQVKLDGTQGRADARSGALWAQLLKYYRGGHLLGAGSNSGSDTVRWSWLSVIPSSMTKHAMSQDYVCWFSSLAICAPTATPS